MWAADAVQFQIAGVQEYLQRMELLVTLRFFAVCVIECYMH